MVVCFALRAQLPKGINEKPRATVGCSRQLIFMYLLFSSKKLVYGAADGVGNDGQNSDIGITILAFPFGNTLRAYPNDVAKLLLRYVLLAAKGFELWGNNDFFHI